jgi:hypothetical protein
MSKKPARYAMNISMELWTLQDKLLMLKSKTTLRGNQVRKISKENYLEEIDLEQRNHF